MLKVKCGFVNILESDCQIQEKRLKEFQDKPIWKYSYFCDPQFSLFMEFLMFLLSFAR